ncbi:MAG: SurA N-terminal domain-containing protein [Gammaproteobacteria bacterium]|nr:SurA N-terminal domain-containing protein [Gammaproteobacteria bacterium]MDG2339254.1 SurA N-terminal domain-containing protein [Gammaproteobacteria bacterium]
MLQDIRDNSQGVVAKVIIGFIVAIFALFGVDSIMSGFTTSPPVAEINGEEITEAQLQLSTQNLLNSIGGSADSLDQSLLEQIALSQILEEVLLRQSAQNSAMTISNNRIDRSIIENPQFQINGAFDSDFAIRTMASQGFNVPLYRETLQQQMLLSQLANAYSSSAFVTDGELERIAGLSAQTRDFRYLSIPLGTRTLGKGISDAEIQAYYDDNQEDFTQPETVSVGYMMLDKNAITEEIELDEVVIRAQYESEREAFEGSAEKRASHILFEVGGDLTEAQALELAATAKQRLDAGEDFGEVALDMSTDTISAEDGGDIGYTDGSAFPEAIEEALEVLALNEISGPVVSDFGVHIVMLTEDSENVFQSYEEVAERIERELKSSEIELIYAERLEDLSNLAFETGDLQTISEELDMDVLFSGAFARSGGSGIFSNQALIAAAFSEEVLLEGNNSEVVELNPSQAVVMNVLEFTEAIILPLEEVEPEIAVILRTEMERLAVQDLSDQILTAIENDDSVEQLLTVNELEWLTEQGSARVDASVNREILNRVFAMSLPETDAPAYDNLVLSNDTAVIVELNSINAGSIETLAQIDKENMVSSMISDLGNSDFQAYMSNLQQSADIESSILGEAPL